LIAAEFYETIESESSAVEFFMQTHGLLPSVDTNPSNCIECDGMTKINLSKKRLAAGEVREYTAARCVKKGCRTFQSVRKIGCVFHLY